MRKRNIAAKAASAIAGFIIGVRLAFILPFALAREGWEDEK